MDAATLETQIALAQIPAPSLNEEARAAFVADRFEGSGLLGVKVDGVGNVRGTVPACVQRDAAPVLVCAHMDTVFAAETDLAVRRENGRIYAPGITDNARGLAVLLALARVLAEDEIAPVRPLHLIASVGEEGIGDLRGVKHLFRPRAALGEPAAFIAVDGAGLRRIVHRAIGCVRLRATVEGPGGHSWADWGTPNPIHALGAAIAVLRTIALETDAHTTLSVTRIGGGTSINSLPDETWLEIDIRSEGADALARTEAKVRSTLDTAVRRENSGRRSGTPPLSLCVRTIGERPAGATPATDPLVRAALAATEAVGVAPALAAASTDANIPISLGVPAVTLGAGGHAGGVHTLGEWYSNEGGSAGAERALLTVLAAAGLD